MHYDQSFLSNFYLQNKFSDILSRKTSPNNLEFVIKVKSDLLVEIFKLFWWHFLVHFLFSFFLYCNLLDNFKVRFLLYEHTVIVFIRFFRTESIANTVSAD